MKKLYIHKIIFAVFLLCVFFIYESTNAQTTETITDPLVTTWTAPAGVTSITVECWGAGGGGGGGNTNGQGSGGGGGGGYTTHTFNDIVPLSSYNITIGQGGSGGNKANGTTGGNTVFIGSITITAFGGVGGFAATGGGNPAPGDGGDGGTGDFAGGTGGSGNSTAVGGGGGSSAGTGNDGTAGGTPTVGIPPADGGSGGVGGSGTPGSNGTIPGGGGGGGGDRGDVGGNGANGQIKITYTVSVTPSITLDATNADVCEGSSPADFTFSAVGNGADEYSITYDAAAIAVGFTNVGFTTLPAAPGTISLTVPGTATADTYNATLKVQDSGSPGTTGDYSITITVNALPNLVITDPAAVCSPATVDLTAPAVTAGSDAGTLSYFTDAGLTTPIPDETSVGSGTYYIKLTDGNSCESSGSVTATVNPIPNIVITDPAAVCSPNTVDLTDPAVTTGSDAGTFTYFTDAGLTTPIPDETAVAATGTYYIKLTDANTCTNSGSVTVTINDVLSAGAITGPTSVTESSSNTYSVTAQGGATNYIWTFPATWSPTSIDPGTNSESSTAGASGGDVQVEIENVCGTGPASTLSVAISGGNNDPVINVPATLDVCGGNTLTLGNPPEITDTDGDTQGVTISVTNGTLDIIEGTLNVAGDGTNSITITNDVNATLTNIDAAFNGAIFTPTITSGTATIQIDTDDGNGGTDSKSFDITVKGDFTAPAISGPTNVAPLASTLAYSVPVVPGALTYTWTLPTGWSLDTDNGDNILVTSGNDGQNGNIEVDITYECGASPTNSILAVTVSSVTDHTGITCATCHTLHNAAGDVLTNNANADLCMSCHNNTPGSDAENKPFAPSDIAVPGTSGNSHAWDVPSVNSTYETNTPSNTEMAARLDGGNIICSTCHDQHNSAVATPYLRIDNTDDAMCKDCHSARDVDLLANGGKGSHPIGNNVIYDDTDTRFENTQTLIANGGKVQCSTCHGVHNVANDGTLTTDGYLLKMDNTGDALCLDCHVPMTHNGMTCSNCHDVHNHTDKNNIYLIRSDIGSGSVYTTQGVGADGDATYNGICEVCHTTTTYHRNNATGDHSHEIGTACTNCHEHASGFSGGSCISCHNIVQAPDARSGAPQIVGTGGQFDILAQSSTHVGGSTPSEPTKENCESCHYTASHPTNAMGLRDIDAVDTEWATNNEAYCIQCHDGGMPTNIVDYSAFSTATYDKSNFTITSNKHDDAAINSCANCHDKHGSTSSNLLTIDDTDNYTVCASCHTSGQPAATFPITGWTSGTNSHAWGVSASSGLNGTNAPTGGGTLDSRLSGGNIVCSTCHDVHDNTNSPNLVGVKDDMCIECHANRNQTNFAGGGIGHHPVGVIYTAGGDYVSPAPTLGDAQVGPVGGDGGTVECSSCHKVHNGATNDGNLLREDMTVSSAVCKECHNYKTHSTNNHDCLDCHQMHNTTNAMLIRTSIDTPVDGPVNVVFTSQGGVGNEANSFADGDANYNGVCEVCHDPAFDGTPLGHHRNDGSDGTNHNDGLNCTGCHAHNDATTSFPNSSCHSCHEGTPGNEATYPQLFPATGSHEIHAGETNRIGCSICHDGYGEGGASEPTHSSGTTDIAFSGMAVLNGAPTWDSGAKTCSNVYCHDPGEIGLTAPVWGGLAMDCSSCHGAALSLTSTFVAPPTESHSKHVGAQYNYDCATCHFGYDNTKTTHIDGTKDVAFDASGLASANSSSPSWNSGTQTCSNVYCHGDAQADYFGTPVWGGAAMGCVDCHNENLSMTATFVAPPTKSHPKHVGADYNYDCAICHDGYDNTLTTHVDGSKDVALSGLAIQNSPSAAWDGGTSSCSSIYCHSDGAPTITYNNPNPWGGVAVACGDCHTATSPGTNAHDKHADGTLYSFGCSTCHNNHINGTYGDVAFHPDSLAYPFGADAGLTPTFNADNTCSNIYCHSDGRNAYRGSLTGQTSDHTDDTWSNTQGSQAGSYPAITPAWDTGVGSLTCNSCHFGPTKGNPSGPVTGIMGTPNTITNATATATLRPGTGTHNSGSHSGMTQAHWTSDVFPTGTSPDLTDPWNDEMAVQCFVCHNADGNWVQTANTKLQGTYGTGYHVDGKTWFNPFNYDPNNPTTDPLNPPMTGPDGQAGPGQGTMAPGHIKSTATHCASGQSGW